ncbi:MAG: glycosyltransferase family 2 protein [Pseudomonadota bacterium]
MKFSVIITLYNKEDYVGRALHSVLGQDRRPDQIIIVDDCSTDNSVAAAKAAIAEQGSIAAGVDIQFHHHGQNGGPSVARNTALGHVTGDYVFLLDADDELKPGVFSRAQHIFEAYDASLLFLQFERDPGGRVLPVIDGLMDVVEPLEPDIYRIPRSVQAFGHDSFGMNGSSVACKASALRGHLYQENLNCFEGLDFWYRVARAMEARGKGAVLLGGIQVTIHLVPHSVSRKRVDQG